MTMEQTERFSLQGWSLSLGIHAVVVVCALAFVAQVKPVLQEEVFRWDVALVRTTTSDSEPTPSVPAAVSAKARGSAVPAPPAESQQETPLTRVAPQQSAQMVHPVIEPVQPVERKIEPPSPQTERTEAKPEPLPPHVEPVERRTPEVAAKKVEPLARRVEVPQPNIEPPAHETVQERKPEPVPGPEPLVARSQPAAPAETTDVHSMSTHQEPVAHSSVGPVSRITSPTEVSPAPALDQEPGQSIPGQATRESAHAADPASALSRDRGASDALVQVAKAAPAGPEAKTDHRWLAESLWRRVAEVKRYPASARLNGLQGKVVLKAVIRSDGQLAEVSVQKSSGHRELDAAAMDAVRQACPLEMKQPIAKPEIVVSLPIVYSLAN